MSVIVIFLIIDDLIVPEIECENYKKIGLKDCSARSFKNQ